MRPIRRVWVTRTQPGAEQTAARLRALRFDPIVAPLLEIRRLPAVIDLSGVEALAFTSPNAVAAFAALSPARALPVFTVGDATAEAARRAGFDRVRSAAGALDDLAALIRRHGAGLRLLHPSAARPAGDLAAQIGSDFRIDAVPVYDSVETGVAAPAFDAVLIHSPRAAQVLAAILSPAMTSGRLAVAISSAASEPASALGFTAVRQAARPDETALLAALGNPLGRV